MAMTKEECTEAFNNTDEFKHFHLHSDSTLMKLNKAELIDYIHMLHHNWQAADEQLHNVIEQNVKLADNPPLSFGDLKEGMWVWDDEEKWYMKIVFLFAPCKQYHFKGSFKVWADSCERSLDFVVFEENRFYRRQKEE